MAEYIEREVAQDYARHAYAKGLNVIEYLEEVPAADVIDREEAARMLEAEADKFMGMNVHNIVRAGALRSGAGMIRSMGMGSR